MAGGDNYNHSSHWALHGGNQRDWALYNRTILLELSNGMARTLLPAILFLAVLMVVGTVGNCLTIYIYGFKFKPTTQNCLFMWLGIFDFVSCVIGIPSEIVDLSLQYMYDISGLCKVLRFLLVFSLSSSYILVVVIAMDRYRHVCKPLHSQMEIVHARMGVGVAVAMAVIWAAVSAGLYGMRTVQTPIDGLEGSDCSFEEQYQNHVYPLLYQTITMTFFISGILFLAFLYIRMCLEIRRCQLYSARRSVSSVQLSRLRISDPEGNGSSAATPKNAQHGDTLHEDGQSEIFVKTRRTIRASKSMRITLAVTVTLVLSYLPNFILILLRTAIADFDQLTGVQLVLYKLSLRSYFMNSVANVFIYSGMNLKFRSQCRKVCGAEGIRDTD